MLIKWNIEPNGLYSYQVLLEEDGVDSWYREVEGIYKRE